MTAACASTAFWKDKRVLLTGHTGFKGAWAALWLNAMGARVSGFALAPDTDPALFTLAAVDTHITSTIGDLRDAAAVARGVTAAEPEIVLHLAAQPIVRRAIADPVETIATNVLGTAHLLDALRSQPSVNTILVITSDKVYFNDDAGRAFSETDRLGGKDPYSASKAATELITRSFAETYFEGKGVRVATARGGNVVGGGDYAADRIIPDIVRAVERGEAPVLRMPQATRPWQHVLDCVNGYLLHAEALARDGATPRSLNFGPVCGEDVTVGQLTTVMLKALGSPSQWRYEPVAGAKEMATLAVDSSLARSALNWRDALAGDALVDWTAQWYKDVAAGRSAYDVTMQQIAAYSSLGANSK